MLAGSLLLDATSSWDTGLYAFLYPEDNEPCRRGAQLYGDCLSDARTFAPVTLEILTSVLEAETGAAWTRELCDRYLGWSKMDWSR
jgi:hypothetical protein